MHCPPSRYLQKSSWFHSIIPTGLPPFRTHRGTRRGAPHADPEHGNQDAHPDHGRAACVCGKCSVTSTKFGVDLPSETCIYSFSDRYLEKNTWSIWCFGSSPSHKRSKHGDFPSRHRSAWPEIGTGWDSEIAGSPWRGPVPRVPMAQWWFHLDFHGDLIGT